MMSTVYQWHASHQFCLPLYNCIPMQIFHITKRSSGRYLNTFSLHYIDFKYKGSTLISVTSFIAWQYITQLLVFKYCALVQLECVCMSSNGCKNTRVTKLNSFPGIIFTLIHAWSTRHKCRTLQVVMET